MDPPVPEGLGIAPDWDGQPVDFFDNVTYTCENNNLFFEEDRDMEGFEVQCLDSGYFDTPWEGEWPTCVDNVYCETPPEKPWGGAILWNQKLEYSTEIRYSCNRYAQFLAEEYEPPIKYSDTFINCQWNKTWTRDKLDRCICESRTLFSKILFSVTYLVRFQGLIVRPCLSLPGRPD